MPDDVVFNTTSQGTVEDDDRFLVIDLSGGDLDPDMPRAEAIAEYVKEKFSIPSTVALADVWSEIGDLVGVLPSGSVAVKGLRFDSATEKLQLIYREEQADGTYDDAYTTGIDLPSGISISDIWTWARSSDTTTTVPLTKLPDEVTRLASTSDDGQMSSEDKAKLDDIEDEATADQDALEIRDLLDEELGTSWRTNTATAELVHGDTLLEPATLDVTTLSNFVLASTTFIIPENSLLSFDFGDLAGRVVVIDTDKLLEVDSSTEGIAKTDDTAITVPVGDADIFLGRTSDNKLLVTVDDSAYTDISLTIRTMRAGGGDGTIDLGDALFSETVDVTTTYNFVATGFTLERNKLYLMNLGRSGGTTSSYDGDMHWVDSNRLLDLGDLSAGTYALNNVDAMVFADAADTHADVFLGHTSDDELLFTTSTSNDDARPLSIYEPKVKGVVTVAPYPKIPLFKEVYSEEMTFTGGQFHATGWTIPENSAFAVSLPDLGELGEYGRLFVVHADELMGVDDASDGDSINTAAARSSYRILDSWYRIRSAHGGSGTVLTVLVIGKTEDDELLIGSTTENGTGTLTIYELPDNVGGPNTELDYSEIITDNDNSIDENAFVAETAATNTLANVTKTNVATEIDLLRAVEASKFLTFEIIQATGPGSDVDTYTDKRDSHMILSNDLLDKTAHSTAPTFAEIEDAVILYIPYGVGLLNYLVSIAVWRHTDESHLWMMHGYNTNMKVTITSRGFAEHTGNQYSHLGAIAFG